MLVKCCGCARLFTVKMRMCITTTSSTVVCYQLPHLHGFLSLQLTCFVSYPLLALSWCFYGIFCNSVGVWPSFWFEIDSATSVPTTSISLLVTLLCRAKNNFAVWCRPEVQTAPVAISDLIYVGYWTGRVRVCVFYQAWSRTWQISSVCSEGQV